MSTRGDYNRVMLMGHLGRDPEFKEFEEGQAAYFCIALNEEWMSKEGLKQRTTWVDCRINGGGAKVIRDNMSKGRRIFVEGKLVLDKWQNKEGQNREKLRVVVNEFHFVDAKPSAGDEDQVVMEETREPENDLFVEGVL